MHLSALRAAARLLLPLGAALAALPARAEVRLALRPQMVYNESGVGDARLLVDEQDAVGDPASGKGARPIRPYFPGWPRDLYPAHVIVDLGTNRALTRLFLFNESGESTVAIETGGPERWKSRDVKLAGYHAWVEAPLGASARYLRLTLPQPTNIGEIVLYAAGPAAAAVPPALPRHMERAAPQPAMDQFIGTNAFIDDPVALLAVPVRFVREYHNWQWDLEGPGGLLRFQPSGAAGGNLWRFDDYYAALNSRGLTVCPAIQQTASTYFPGGDADWKPVAKGDRADLPASYRLHAAHLFQFAARYGGTKVAPANLHIAPDQPVRSGLSTLRYLENWNEPDKTWRGREGRFTPFELAAMCSADYDGDQGRLGPGMGVRTADPRMRLVMGGLAGIHLEYLRAMKLWADLHRGGDFPADVINLHHYSSDGTDEQGFKTTGICPEADHMRERFAEVVGWAHANVPKCAVWATEFGYDTDPRSPLHAPAIGSYSALETQASWLVRSYFALAAAGVDRAAMFMFRDVKADDGGVFASCGLVTEKGKWAPKPSYYYVAALTNRLAGMRFAGDVPSGRPDVTIYRFKGAGRSAYAVWCPTSEDHHVPNFALPIAGAGATRVDFEAGSPGGRSTRIAASNGRVVLEAREKPVLILAD